MHPNVQQGGNMEIKRDNYLNRLIGLKHKKLIKIVTGIRRSGKSYLLFNMFKKHLKESGTDDKHIISIALDDFKNKNLRSADELYKYVESKIVDNEMYYILLDEVQLVDGFVDVLNGFLNIENTDIYVTGSNSKFLSSDIATEFRGRGLVVQVNPLTFSEFYSVFDGSKNDAWKQYYTYGGLPFIVNFDNDKDKRQYLRELTKEVYLNDIVERHDIKNRQALESIIEVISSAIGSLTSPSKLENTFKSSKISDISRRSIYTYIDYLEDAFIIHKTKRYDIKGRKYIETPVKYYFSDLGLRNSWLNYRQIEENHIMENIIYNELIARGYSVDVGVVEIREKDENGVYKNKSLEIDFIATDGSKRYYIQSAFELLTDEKNYQEERPLLNVRDSFKKIIIVKDDIMPKRNEMGILTIGIIDFLLDKNSLDA